MTGSYDVCPAVAIWEVARPVSGGGHEATWKGLAADHELESREARGLLDALAEAGTARLVLALPAGARRADLEELVRHAAASEPGATVELAGPPYPDVRGLADAGARALAFRADGAEPAIEDAARAASACGVPLEIVTPVQRGTLEKLEATSRWVASIGAATWRVAFPVDGAWQPAPAEADSAAQTLFEIATRASFALEIEHLPHVARLRAERGIDAVAPPGDGRGMLFVSWCGDIYPSRELPLPCGNIRMQDLIAVYRFHPMFRMLRDPESLEERCGGCEHRRRCGGSRARAYANGGKVLSSDPLCGYQPRLPRTSFP